MRFGLLVVTVTCVGPACGGGPTGGSATVIFESATFTAGDVKLTLQSGDKGTFRIEGTDANHPKEDCLSGVGGGLRLSGDVPDGVTSAKDLDGLELPFEFSGEGEDRNLCFVGSRGLLGVKDGTVSFGPLIGSSMTFRFAGDFVRYDGRGGESASTVYASGRGTATVE